LSLFFGKYILDKDKNETIPCRGQFFSLSPLTDAAINFYRSIPDKTKALLEFIQPDELINKLADRKVGLLESNYDGAKIKFENIVKDYHIISKNDIHIQDDETSIFLEYFNDDYYWICIVSSNSRKYFLILNKYAELPKGHKSLAKQLKEAEKKFLKNIDYLLAEKIELDPNILLKTIVIADRNNEWKYLFLRTIDLLNNNGYIDILIELLKTLEFKSSSEKNIMRKVEEISENLMHEQKNSKEEYLDNARNVLKLLPFVLNYNIEHDNKKDAIENLKTLIKNDSEILVFDKSERSNCFERILKYINVLIEKDTNNSDRSSFFKHAYDSSKHALDELNAYSKQEEISVSDYNEPDPYLIELYQCQIGLLENAKGTEKITEKIALIDK